MKVRTHRIIAVATLVTTLGGQAFGEQGGGVIRREDPPQSGREIERSALRFSAPWRPPGANTGTRIIGTVIDIRQVPVAAVKLQLRNLDTGNVEQTTESNGNGEYLFEVEDPATFVVEMVMVDGYVVALSNAGSVARYETFNTVVQLPGRWDSAARTVTVGQNVTNFFGLSAETSMTAATISIAVDASIPPANPGVPVSPMVP